MSGTHYSSGTTAPLVVAGLQKRSRKGCRTCRARKVKCDETPGECLNCRKLELDCQWATPAGGPHDNFTDMATLALKATGSVSVPGTSTVPAKRRREVVSPPLPTETSHSRADKTASHVDDVPSFQERSLLLDAFFSRVHPNPTASFVHRSDLLRTVHNGTVSRLLLLAICVISYRFSSLSDDAHPDGGERAAFWACRIRHDLMENLDRFSRPTLGATLFLIQHDINSGRSAAAWTLNVLATRMAFALGLNRQGPTGAQWVQAEVSRRLMWSSFCVDAMTHGGILEYCSCPASAVRINLPADEHNFALSIPEETDPLQRPPSLGERKRLGGLMSQYVRLMAIRTDVIQYCKNISEQPLKPWDTASPLQACLDALGRWHAELPSQLEFEEINLYARFDSNALDSLMSLHCWYDTLHASLYRVACPGFDQSLPASVLVQAPEGWVDKMRHGCFIRSCSISNRFRLLAKHFPDHVPTMLDYSMWAHESARNLVQYSQVRGISPGGPMAGLQGQIRDDLQIMVNVVAGMTRYFFCVRKRVQRLVLILVRAGFDVVCAQMETWGESGTQTPAPGAVLEYLPWIRGELPMGSEEVSNKDEDGPFQRHAVDPITLEALSTSPHDVETGQITMASAPPQNEPQHVHPAPLSFPEGSPLQDTAEHQHVFPALTSILDVAETVPFGMQDSSDWSQGFWNESWDWQP